MDKTQDLRLEQERKHEIRKTVAVQIEQYFQDIESNYKCPNWISWPKIKHLEGYLRCARDANLFDSKRMSEFLERIDTVRLWLEENA